MTDGAFIPEYFDKNSNFDQKIQMRFKDQENKLNLVYVNLINHDNVKNRLSDVLDAY